MNWNAIRTFVLGSGILTVVLPQVINVVTTLLNCTGDNPATPELELAVCTGGGLLAIPTWLQATVATVVLAALGLLKTRGTGTIMQKLFAKTVPVVPAAVAGPGVVTEEQVQSTS